MTVTAILVSHDGAAWLPTVLDAVLAQTRRPDRLVAVDTGSTDGSRELLGDRLRDRPAATVLDLPASTSFGAAVTGALQQAPAVHADADGSEGDWLWLLHDDSAPAPDALERLLAEAGRSPGSDLLGPKLREWPSLRRLLEVGVTLSGTGRRETGLERGEYDQGQHDRVRDVLAVNSAGMLVRRGAFDRLGGFDPYLPVFGNDVDLGWRLARAGARTRVVPDAVVFHVEAAHRGIRRTPVTGAYRREERRAALYTLLVNCAAWALPLVGLRLLGGSLIRAVGLLLVRAPRECLDELAALLSVLARPDRIVRGRLRRARTATVPPRAVRHLLAPFWLPYRHGLDFVTDLGAAVVHQVGESAGRRRPRGAGRPSASGPLESGPVPEEAQNLPEDTGWLARLVTSPVPAVFTLLVLLALLGTRGLLGGGVLSGGALAPAPDGATDWWGTYLDSWHRIGVGSAAPAPPFLVPLAALASVLLGKAWLVVDVLFLLAVPLAAAGAYRFLLGLTGARLPALWGAVSYGLVPVLSGAVGQGRLGSVVAALVLPWLAASARFLSDGVSADRRWRAAWRTALWLAVLVAFVPLAWPMAVALALLAVAAGLVTATARWRRPGTWGPVLVAAVIPVFLLVPWSLPGSGVPLQAWLVEAGRAVPGITDPLGGWDLVLGRAGDLGAAPAWLGAGLVLAALAALLRSDTRRPVLAAWLVLLVAVATTALLAGQTFRLPAWPVEQVLWLGFPVLVAQAAAITAATCAATGLSSVISSSAFGWRQPVGLVVAAAAVLSTAGGVVWWAVTGTPGPLDRAPVTDVPTYMADAARRAPDQGVLVVRRAEDGGLRYVVLRDDGLRLGDSSVAPSVEAMRPLTRTLTDLATVATAEDVQRLGRHGIAFVYAAPPVDLTLAANLDSVAGLRSASAVHPGARAWQLDEPSTAAALRRPPPSDRGWWLVLQAGLVLVVAVLAGPTRRPVR